MAESPYVGKDGLMARELAKAVNQKVKIASDDTGRLYRYHQGVWLPDGDRVVRYQVRELLGNDFRRSHAETTVEFFRVGEPRFTDDAAETRYLNLPNGLLDWQTGQLCEHDPKVPSTIRIPVEWDPDQTCPAVDDWVASTFGDSMAEFVYEVIGYALYNGNPLHKAVLLYGKGRNGKGTLLRLMTALIGPRNVSAVTPQSLDDNRFRAAQLHGKLANLVGDVDPRIFRATETFKQVTGEDLVTAERKHQQPFQFTCRALIVAAFNSRPRSADATEGFFSRWVVVPFAGYFPADDPRTDPNLTAKLTTPAELCGLLVQAVAGMRRVMGRGRFDPPDPVRRATAEFRKVADPVRAFAEDQELLLGFKARTDIYNRYGQWCDANGHHKMSSGQFYERLDTVGLEGGRYIFRPTKQSGTRGYNVQERPDYDGGSDAEPDPFTER